MDIYISIIIIIFIIIIDQISKWLAYKYIKPKAKYKNKVFYFSYVENSGMAYGHLSGEYIYFYIATIITIIGLSFLTIYLDFKNNFLFSVGLSMIFGGALGNFIDRVFRGFVIDFITGKIFKKHLPVYNISDFCLLIGALLMLISFIGDLIL